ncbi:hypothetical protein Tco_0337599 [Tanacetum coccineum]
MDQVTKHDAEKGTNDHKRKFDDRRNKNNTNYYNNHDNNNYPNNRDNNNYPNDRNNNNYQNNCNNNNNNRNNDYHQQQNERHETFRAYGNHGYNGPHPLCRKCVLHHIGPCTVSHVFPSPHPIIILSDSDVEDTFSSTHSPDYIPASPDYFPASPGNTSPNFSDDLTKDLLASLALLPFYDDLYMKVMQAYDATDNELPQAPIAPPTILPPSPMLSLSPMFDFPTFLSSREDFTT